MIEGRPKVAVIGSGYWGKNLVRNFHELGALACVCDTRQEVLAQVRNDYKVHTACDFDSVLSDAQIEGVVIAAPAAQHFELAQRALLAGKDVYVEKPLALHAQEGERLVSLANAKGRILMVGHILEYHPAILELKRLISEGELGQIRYIYSSRLNLGKLRTEENILWSFAPHDISAILYLLGEMPARVASHGGSYVNPKVSDVTLTTCEFNSGVQAHIFVSWLHPFKEQKLTVVGGRKMAVFDDMEPERKLVLYAHRITWVDRVPTASKDSGLVVPLPKLEPLRSECEHFLSSIQTRLKPRTNGESALRVLQVLEAAERSLCDSGDSVEVAPVAPKYFADATAVIDPGCKIGNGTKIWHFSHVMSGSEVGENCNFGQNVVISPGVTVGNNVKIQNNVSVYTGVVLEDDVFCGPSMVFTNVINPRSHVVRKHEYKKTLVKKGASIGANATIVCGATLGKYCFVAAGAVVTHDVPDFALVMGVPAQHSGWMCSCGLRLPGDSAEVACSACGRSYLVTDGACREIEVLMPTETKRPIPIAA